MRYKASLTQATNCYGDLVSSALALRDIDNTWRPTLDKVAPQVCVSVGAGYLERTSATITLKPCGNDGSSWLWRMTLVTDELMADMTPRDRLGIDAVINTLFNVVDYVRQQNEFYG